MIDAHSSPVPAVLEIPSKDHPYDASKDSILRRAKVNTPIIKKLNSLFKIELFSPLTFKQYILFINISFSLI